MLNKVQKISEQFNIAVFITNQVMADPGGGMSYVVDPKKPIGGHILAHASQTRMFLRKGKGEQRVCKIWDSPTIPESECLFQLSEGGIIDAIDWTTKFDQKLTYINLIAVKIINFKKLKMLSQATRYKGFLLLKSISENEQIVEEQRQQLCKQNGFEPWAGFKRIDRQGQGKISAHDIITFLNENMVDYISEAECFQMFRFFDRDNDGFLDFEDFL